MLKLKTKPTLHEIQKYVEKMEIERGFIKEPVIQKCLLLGEEVGELFKAIRKTIGIKIDKKSLQYNVEDELADVLIYLCEIANRYNIDLEKAFRKKEDINKKRVWEKLTTKK